MGIKQTWWLITSAVRSHGQSEPRYNDLGKYIGYDPVVLLGGYLERDSDRYVAVKLSPEEAERLGHELIESAATARVLNRRMRR